VFDRDPEFAREALTNIERRGREALAELDRIIGLVRSDEPARRPVPELADIETMIDEIEEAGMAIEKHLAPPPTTPEIGRAAYRVVQEALTNVAKHAPGAATRVSVIGTDRWLEIEVVNTPPDQPPVHTVTGTGSGLSGIRQRVEILGGQSEAGPTPEGGFRVYASLPAMGKDRA
jgi:signal transduction histidine kinase